jgi:hypothetical protein
MNSRIIKVTSCKECPYKCYNDGQGHMEPYTMCVKFHFVIEDENRSFDLNKIHPKCQLEKSEDK